MTEQEALQAILNDKPVKDDLLDYWVAKSEGIEFKKVNMDSHVTYLDTKSDATIIDFNFVMPILQRGKIDFEIYEIEPDKYICCFDGDPDRISEAESRTYLEAIKRCLIKRKYT